MPDPESAFSVARESKTAVKLVCASTSAGTPSRPRVWSSTAWTGADFTTPVKIDRGRSRCGTSPRGPALVTFRSMGVANCGAPAAPQKVLIISATGCGSGLTRWKASPSRSGRWARWSIALAT